MNYLKALLLLIIITFTLASCQDANGPYSYYNLIEKERSLANEYLKNSHEETAIKKYNDILKELFDKHNW